MLKLGLFSYQTSSTSKTCSWATSKSPSGRGEKNSIHFFQCLYNVLQARKNILTTI